MGTLEKGKSYEMRVPRISKSGTSPYLAALPRSSQAICNRNFKALFGFLWIPFSMLYKFMLLISLLLYRAIISRETS